MADQSEHDDPASDAARERPERGGWRAWLRGSPRRWAVRAVILVVALALAAHYVPKLLYSLSHASTDDAYVDGTIVPVSPQVAGRVVKVFIHDNENVAEGAKLVQIDPSDYAARVEVQAQHLASARAAFDELVAQVTERERALAEAKANAQVAEAQRDLARKERDRIASLRRRQVVSQSEYDRAQASFKVTTAQVAAAEATVARAEADVVSAKAQRDAQKSQVSEAEASLELARLDLDRTLIRAPMAGRVSKKSVDPGQYVQPGERLFALVDLTSVYVTANFKETQVGPMRIGQPVDIEVDAYPGHRFRGHVQSFQAGTGSVFSLLPPENATGNFVKVVQRVPVKIVFDTPPDAAHPLFPGMSVVPYVDTHARPEAKTATTEPGAGTSR